MQLAKLELFGFKSFAEKTEFVFEPGITAFVGPNGCGKSNIVDAVKWVLGEQSAKSLRGNEMLDIIFNGANGRKPLGFAEASLTIRNNKGLLPLEYTEICITRRLYRSGESEYLLNKKPVRLKDIRELFMDTGVGANVYAVIEQGQVDWLLQASAQERRYVFEEAAGISKYKAKKKAALAKLERVTQNLLRLGDIIDEVEKQLRAVKVQAAKAVRYKAYAERLRQLRIATSLHSFRELELRRDETAAYIQEASNAEQKIKNQIEQVETELAQYEVKMSDLDIALSTAQAEVQGIDSQLNAARQKIVLETTRIAEATQTEQKYQASIEALKARMEVTRQELTAAQAHLVEATQEIEKLKNHLTAKSDEVNQVTQRCAEIAQQIEADKAKVIDLLQQDSRLQNELARIESERTATLARRGRIQQRQAELQAEAQTIIQQEKNLEAERDQLNGQLNDNRKKLDALSRQLQSAHQKLEALRTKLEDTRQRKAAAEKHRDLLQELEARAEGVEAGVKAVLTEAAREGSSLKGIKGMVADLVKVDLPLALAIEAALGERAQYIVVEKTEHARAAIDYLQKNKLGRAGFLPMDRLWWNDGITAQLLAHKATLHKAVDLVEFDESVGKVFQHLLGGTVIVENLRTAMEISSNGGSRMQLVTLHGDRVEPKGSISGGTQVRGGIISRKSELVALEKELADLTANIEHLDWDIRQEAQRIQQMSDEAVLLQKTIEEGNINRLSKENEIKQCQHRMARINEEMALLEADLTEIAAILAESQNREAAIRQSAAQLATQRKALEDEIARGIQAQREQDVLREKLNADMTAIKVSIAQAEEKQQNLQASISTLESELQERQDQITAVQKDIELCAQKRAESQAIIQQTEAEVQQLSEKKKDVESRMCTLRQERDTLRQRHTAGQEQMRKLRIDHDQIAERLSKLRLEESEIQIKMDGLADRIREEYQVELKDLRLDPIELWKSLAKNKCPETEQEEVSNEEAEEKSQSPEHATTPPAPQWDELQKEITDLHSKLARMGGVNLDAIQEQSELEQRHIFLTKQRDDLLQSKHHLENIIQKINRTSREMFETTFNAVRNNFQILFKKLFGGGSADITLEPDVDILDAGIEITARPPGKEPRSLSLLSGGERAMTTIALLFAIFQAKPSPFCILDEVDAPLDESNIDRFILLLKEFAANSQFLIITHNKRTMSIADVMYGITMQDTGISKKISVKFINGAEQKVA